MTAVATPARRSPAATRAEGVVRTARHLYYFNGRGPWPGVTSITRVLDAPALTNWSSARWRGRQSRTPSD